MLHMDNAKELDHLLGKWMSLSALQKAMKRAGINIFVNEYSDKYVSINSKVMLELALLLANISGNISLLSIDFSSPGPINRAHSV